MTTGELRDHVFDGIQEFDNRLPNWWLWTFYVACLFSVFYWLHFHTLGTGDLPAEAYVQEQRAAAARLEAALANVKIDDDVLLKLASEPAVVAEGEKIFKNPALCTQCHKEDGSGNIGPNLTDRFWINGGSPMEIYNTVMNGGRPGKGMNSWKDNGITFVQRAVAYVLSLRDRNLPGKPPEPDAREYAPTK
jgi:cytochrome c oxidase cbb3-type subunit 3